MKKEFRFLLMLCFVYIFHTQTYAQITVPNNGAETGSISPWTGTGLINTYASKSYEGSYSFLLKRNDNYLEQTISGLVTNNTYTLTAYIFVDGSDGTSVEIGAKNYGSQEVFVSGNNQLYQQVSIEFTTGSANTSATIFMRHNQGGWKWCYIDNIELSGYVPPVDTEAPTIPDGLSVSNLTFNSIELSWNASNDNVEVTEYEVFQNGSPVGTTSTTSLLIAGLDEQTVYSYTVSASDLAGNTSDQSAPLSVTTPAAPDTIAPEIPTGVAASALTTNSVTLNWTASNDNVGVTEYEVFRDGIAVGTTGDISIEITGLNANTLYEFSVTASDAAGNTSDQSTPLQVSTLNDGGTGGTVDVPNGGAESGSISPWTGNGLVSSTSSKVYEGGYAFLVKRNENLLEQVITGLTPNTDYTLSAYVFVDGSDATNIAIGAKSFGSTEVSVASNAQNYTNVSVDFTTGSTNTSVTLFIRHNQAGWKWAYADQITIEGGSVQEDTQKPTAPGVLTAESVSTTTVNLIWDAATDNIGVVSYNVYQNNLFIGSTNQLQYEVTGLLAATQYSFMVTALDAAENESNPSNELIVNTLDTDNTPPTIPGNLRVTSIGFNSVDLEWNASTDEQGIDRYEVFIGSQSTSTTNNTTITITGLTPQTPYSFKVRAIDVNDNISGFSNIINVTTTEVPETDYKNIVGIGLSGPKDWEEAFIFADAIMSSRQWDCPAGVDANGWPKGDGSLVVAHGIENLHGKYKLRYEGQADVTVSVGTISNISYNASTNTTTADVVVTNEGAPLMQLNVANSVNGVRNVKLMRPIYPGAQQSHNFDELVHREIKTFIQRGFNLVRFMDLLGTNSDPYHKRVEFSYRLTPNYATQAADWDLDTYSRNHPSGGERWFRYQGIGAAFEYVILMCNEMQVDCWINISHCANDDRIRKVAQLFKYGSDGTNPYTSPQANPVYPPLDPNLNLYVEYSNEVWNWRFPCTRYVEDLDLNNSFAITAAERAVNTSLIFREVFGDAQMMTRVKPLFEWQKGKNDSDYGNAQSTGTRGLMWVEANMPQPVDYYFYGGGGSGYYSPGAGGDINTVWDLSEFDAQNWLYPKQEYMAYLTSCYGLRRCVYEGGPSFGDEYGGTGDNTLGQLVLHDPRLGDEIIEHQEAWNSIGGDAFCNFTISGDHRWGWINEPNEPNAKILGAEQIVNQPRTPITLGYEVTPTSYVEIPGNQWRFSNVGLGGYNWRNTSISNGSYTLNNEWVSYHFHVTADDSYKVRINYKTTANSSIKVYEGSSLLGTLTLQNSDGAVAQTNWLNFAATIEFLRAIRVQKINGSIEIISIEIAGNDSSKGGVINSLFQESGSGKVLSLYPNPATNYVEFSGSEEFYSFELINYNGQVIKTGQLNENQNRINISDISNGVYFIRLSNDSYNNIFRILKK